MADSPNQLESGGGNPDLLRKLTGLAVGNLSAEPPAMNLTDLPKMKRSAACRMAGFLVREDQGTVYLADLHGTWVLPPGSYESLEEWSGGQSAPESMRAAGKPVQVVLKQGALIHEIRPVQIRHGGDPAETERRRTVLEHIFTLDGEVPPVTSRAHLGERQLASLEEVFARRMGWDPSTDFRKQVFEDHHLRSASWNCGSDGGGS